MNKEIKISPRQIAKAINDLLEENEQLKEQIEEYQKALDEIVSEKMDFEERIDKAIDFIENNFCIENCLDLKEIIKILKGDSNGNI